VTGWLDPRVIDLGTKIEGSGWLDPRVVDLGTKIEGSGWLDPRILDLGTKIEGSGWLDPRVVDLCTKIDGTGHFQAPDALPPAVHWIGGLYRPQSRLDDVEKIPDSTEIQTPTPRSCSS
jgi:hypothetical protein